METPQQYGPEKQRKPSEEPEQKALTPQVMTREIIREPGRTEIVSGGGGPPLDPLDIIEQRARSIGRIRQIAIAATVAEHWTNQGGKPYLTSAGAQAAARIAGVKVTNVSDPPRREEHRDGEGTYYEYVYTGTFSLPGDLDRIEGVTGSCTSRDDLLGTGGTKMIEDVDPGDVRKKAQTNLLQRGITQILGLRGLEWSTLAQFGITPDGATKIDYKHGAKGGGHQGEEFSFKFGKQKGIPISKLSEEDLGWYLKTAKESLADPEKKKYQKNSQEQIDLVEKELARRKNTAAGATAATGPAADGPTIWKRIQVLADEYDYPRGEKDADLIGLVKKATGKSARGELVEEDFKKVQAAMTKAVKELKSGGVDGF